MLKHRVVEIIQSQEILLVPILYSLEYLPSHVALLLKTALLPAKPSLNQRGCRKHYIESVSNRQGRETEPENKRDEALRRGFFNSSVHTVSQGTRPQATSRKITRTKNRLVVLHIQIIQDSVSSLRLWHFPWGESITHP